MRRVAILLWIERFIPFGRMANGTGREKKRVKRLSFFGKLDRIITTLMHEGIQKQFFEIMDKALTRNDALRGIDCLRRSL